MDIQPTQPPTTPTPPLQPIASGRRPSNKKRNLMRIIISLLILAVVGGGLVIAMYLLKASADNQAMQSRPVREDSDERENFSKGKTATFGYFEVKVNNATRGYTPNDGSLPITKGYTFLLVNITAKNTDKEPRLMSDIDLGVLVDRTIINASFTRVEPAFNSGIVDPGNSVTGNLLYEVPPDGGDVRLFYNTQLYSNEDEKLKKIEYTLAF